jgi:hypothetical protein
MQLRLFVLSHFRCRKRDPNPKQEMSCVKPLSLYPLLGLAHLAGALKGAGYEQVKIVDAWPEDLTESAFLEAEEGFNPDLAGLTWLGGSMPSIQLKYFDNSGNVPVAY